MCHFPYDTLISKHYWQCRQAQAYLGKCSVGKHKLETQAFLALHWRRATSYQRWAFSIHFKVCNIFVDYTFWINKLEFSLVQLMPKTFNILALLYEKESNFISIWVNFLYKYTLHPITEKPFYSLTAAKETTSLMIHMHWIQTKAGWHELPTTLG